MKKSITVSLFTLLVSIIILAQNPSAILDLESTTQGLLLPVMSKIQMSSIISRSEGLIVYCTDCPTKGPHFFNGLFWIGPDNLPGDLKDTDRYNPITQRVWMDRNLGASQVATSSIDPTSYGDLYQWGRLADGHEIRTSATTGKLSNTDVPIDGKFILPSSAPFDWRSPSNANLWQGVSGVSNPCPRGYRLPTVPEWDAERLTWTSQNAAGAYASQLKLPLAGVRFGDRDGEKSLVGVSGYYWTSNVSGTSSRLLYFDSSEPFLGSGDRADGCSVRCIKN